MKKSLFVKFVPPSPEIKAIVQNEVRPYLLEKFNIAPNSRTAKLNIMGANGVVYRGETYYYVAYTVDRFNEVNKGIESIKKRTLKLMKLKEAMQQIEKYNDDVEHKLDRFYATSLNPASLKRSIKNNLSSVSTEHRRRHIVRYLVFKVWEKDCGMSQRFITINGTTVRSTFACRYDEAGRSDLRDVFRDMWQRGPLGIKKAEREENKRTNNRRIEQRRTPYGVLTLVGGVHTEKGVFIRLREEKMRNVLNYSKTPMTKDRHIGVEIEASIPKKKWDDLKAALVKSDLAHYMCLGTDGSVYQDDNFKGGELRLCAPIFKIGDVVKAACEALNSVGAKVDKSCGLHVHLDAREIFHADVAPKRMFLNLVKQQLPLYLTQPASRRGNTYCKYTFDEHFEGDDRYLTINPASLSKYQTIEVRLHAGTLSATKINNWIALLSEIAYGATLKTSYKTVEGLMAALDVGDEIKGYFIGRAEKFSDAKKPVTSRSQRDYQNFTDSLTGEELGEDDEMPLDEFLDDMITEEDEEPQLLTYSQVIAQRTAQAQALASTPW